MKIIVCDTEKCTGCRLCEYACAAYNGEKLNIRQSRMRVLRVEPVFNVAMSCVLCDDPKCLAGCPTQAISFDGKKIVIDQDKCVACGLCAERCEFGSITVTHKTAYVCDFCEQHGTPKCVEHCPKDALKYEQPKGFQKVVRDE